MRMVPVPGKKLLIVLCIPLFFMVVGLFVAFFFKAGIFLDFLLLLVCLAEIYEVYREKKLTVTVKQKDSFHIGQQGRLHLGVQNAGNLTFSVDFRLDLPRFWSQAAYSVPSEIRRKESEDIAISLLPLRRGRYRIETLHMKIRSPLGLFSYYDTVPLDTLIDVYPDFRELKEYFLMSRSNRLFEMGIHKNRYRGRGTELESLREYSKDDDSRFIDWKVSARLNRPVTRVFQMESMNDVVFVLDCGRLMTSEEGNASSLDLAVNALLVLSHVALAMGDRIRIIPFSDKIKGDFLSSRGGNPMKRILNFITPIQAEFVESNYPLVFSHLQASLGKRSLVIFVSDIIDDINYSFFKSNFALLGKKHAILFLLLRDRLLQSESDRDSPTTTDVFSVTAARSMYLKRTKALMKLKQSGVNVLDLLPEQVTARLVDKYMEMKAANRI